MKYDRKSNSQSDRLTVVDNCQVNLGNCNILFETQRKSRRGKACYFLYRKNMAVGGKSVKIVIVLPFCVPALFINSQFAGFVLQPFQNADVLLTIWTERENTVVRLP